MAGDSGSGSAKPERVWKSKEEEIREIENEFARNLNDLRRYYVTPDFQDTNPPEEMNSPSLIASRELAFQSIDRFIMRPGLEADGHRCLFVLGDAGMGKTSLLLMLKLRYLSPAPPSNHACVLMKLGPDTLGRIEKVADPGNTILLLDSLDEDPEAHGAERRLVDLLPMIAAFHRTILTCRTQFFLETSRPLTTLAGHFVIEPYECPLKYLSLFDDGQVDRYKRTCSSARWLFWFTPSPHGSWPFGRTIPRASIRGLKRRSSSALSSRLLDSWLPSSAPTRPFSSVISSG